MDARAAADPAYGSTGSRGELVTVDRNISASPRPQAVMACQVKHKQIFSSDSPGPGGWPRLPANLSHPEHLHVVGRRCLRPERRGQELISSTAYLEPFVGQPIGG